MNAAACLLEPPRTAAGRVLVVDDHASARESIADVLRHAGHRVDTASSAVEALQRIDGHRWDVIVTDLQMPGLSGLELIRELTARRFGGQVVMVTAHASVATAVEAMRLGAFDYIEKPLNVDQLEQLVARAIAQGKLLDGTQPAPAGSCGGPSMVGSSAAMQALRTRIARAAPTAETILICGESGTGKELVARAVHAQSPRHDRPLVGLNCPALSAQLMESELFGHEKGAFTGAEAARAGRFELADGGSILLDEVSEIEPPLQAKLLRVLQERTFERVGSSKTRRVDVRVLATTNRDLQRAVAAGRFREDLFYRLAVIPLEVPPLRARREDVPELIDHFLTRSAERLGREPCRLEPAARELLTGYHWPGNVRELENILTRASVLADAAPLGADELRSWLIDPSGREAPAEGGTDRAAPAVGQSLAELERQTILATLERLDGHRARTAEALGIGLRTLTTKLKEYGYTSRPRRAAA